jgi:small subunit ribosomal protein S3
MINGSIPLHTLQANINYGQVHCLTAYGIIGIKVWIYLGTYAETDAAQVAAANAVRRPRRR